MWRRLLQSARPYLLSRCRLKSRVSVHFGWLFVTGSLLLYSLKHRKKSNGLENVECKVRSLRFSNKVVVITGAAGDIGSATATAFAREGANLVLVDLPHTASRLEDQCLQLEACGAERVVVFSADIRQEKEVQEMVRYTVDTVGPINCFFNNAGIQGDLAPIQEQSTDMFKKVIDVNILGVFLGLKYVSSAMAASGGGVIINTASLAGLLGPRYMASYAASKHAVIGLTKSAAKDLGPYGVRVCAIAPGLLEGRMWTSQVEGRIQCENKKLCDSERQEMEHHLLSGTPLGRLGCLSEVAHAVLFLCSDEASYLTGTVLTIDGGRLP